MPSPLSALVDVEADALEEVRRAVLTLADRQTATLDAITAQGVRLDAVTSAVRAVEGQVATTNGLLAEIAAAMEGKGEGGGDMKALADAVAGMAADLRELREGTGVMAAAVALLAQRLKPTEG